MKPGATLWIFVVLVGISILGVGRPALSQEATSPADSVETLPGAAPPASAATDGDSGSSAAEEAKSAAAEPTATPGDPQKVHIGVYLKNVESISLQDNTYYMDFIIWMRWKGPIDPTVNFRFTNLLDAWGLTMRPAFESPITLPDGSKYNRFSCEGKFYNKFWLSSFPLDWQKVTLEVEDTVSDKELIYVPDTEATALNPALRIPGWRVSGIYNSERRVSYDSNFGQSSLAQKRTFSRYRFGLKLRRPSSFFYIKILPPVMIVLLCCFLIFFLRADYVDARISTVVTALLTAVFLQLTFTANLPDIGMLVLLDQIFNFSYLVMFLILLECIVVTRMVDKAEAADEEASEAGADDKAKLEERSEAIRAQIRKYDRMSLYVFPAAYIAGCVLITIVMGS